MCGIVGTVLGNKIRSAGEYERIREDFSEMLIAAQVRGTDAAGLYIVNEKPGKAGVRQHVLSIGESAERLVNTPAYWELLDNVGPHTIAIVGHTRHATTGSPSDNSNNHPIVDGSLVGVHNGVIYNHEELRAEYGAVAEVDSAAIFSTLKATNEDRGNAALGARDFQQAMPEVEGSWAIAVSDARSQAIFLARNDGSPIQVTYEKKRRALWFASTTAILAQGLGHAVKAKPLPEWSVAPLTRADANRGVVPPQPIQAPKFQRPVGNYGLEDWQRSTGLYQVTSTVYDGRFPGFFDEGSATAAALQAAEGRQS